MNPEEKFNELMSKSVDELINMYFEDFEKEDLINCILTNMLNNDYDINKFKIDIDLIVIFKKIVKRIKDELMNKNDKELKDIIIKVESDDKEMMAIVLSVE